MVLAGPDGCKFLSPVPPNVNVKPAVLMLPDKVSVFKVPAPMVAALPSVIGFWIVRATLPAFCNESAPMRLTPPIPSTPSPFKVMVERLLASVVVPILNMESMNGLHSI